jgi:hypothetical protein
MHPTKVAIVSAFSQCHRFIEPWPVGPISCAPASFSSSGMAAPLWLLLFPTGIFFFLPPILSQPLILRSTTRIRTYPFAGPFAKETSSFLLFMLHSSADFKNRILIYFIMK